MSSFTHDFICNVIVTIDLLRFSQSNIFGITGERVTFIPSLGLASVENVRILCNISTAP
ncbi:hypothetical protein HCUR_00661 [Holospora curviuscula]|uniref:Uncharacterized protein n=1 Tax=Holospora curviuscula TaxID=1082868 RepID=A0A2S5R9K7_9PROT|nr:hypothetical protein HCUR_00661 [Holospora curviuscula]